MKTRVTLPQPSNYHEPGERPGTSFPSTFSGNGPCQQLILDFWPPALGQDITAVPKHPGYGALCCLPPTLLCAPLTLLCAASPQLCSVPISRWRLTFLGYTNRPSCLLIPLGLANAGERRGAKVWLPPLPPHSPALHMKVLAPARWPLCLGGLITTPFTSMSDGGSQCDQQAAVPPCSFSISCLHLHKPS